LSYIWVALGSSLGGIARYACSGLGVRWLGEEFPWGTLFVNVSGSLLIGALAVMIPFEGRIFGADARALLMIGICGGFTTFSSFSLETLNLARNGEWLSAAGYTLGSVALCLAAVWIGYFSAATIVR
jgi:CrcB protein